MLSILHAGLGEIGKATIRALLTQSLSFKLVGVVDTHPALAGRNLRELMPGDKNVPALRVAGSLKEALAGKGVDVVTLTTGSRTVDILPTLELLIGQGIHVVSTCEELSFPALRNPQVAAALDAKAKRAGVTILGTGVNPGFAMDGFALACTGACAAVEKIAITRSLDASKRREQLQKKVGAGMELSAVKKLIRQKGIGHVGLGESCALLAAGLGWDLAEVREKFTAVVAEKKVASRYFTVKPGQVRGMRMVADGYVAVRGKAAQKKISLDLTMALGAETFDEVHITQPRPFPAITVRTTTGFPGDPSTAAILVNCARVAPELAPGLRTMLDVLRVRSVGA